MPETADTGKYYKDCCLCPRKCHADRTAGQKGFCRMGADITCAKAYRHMWEEPCLTGEKGSGTVFFTGCNLGCIFCQNIGISSGRQGVSVSEERLAEIFLELQEQGASNINLVTAVCYIPGVRNSIILAKKQGLRVPVVYNSGGYESAEALALLDGCIDIYMPDMKYMSNELATEYSKAPDYPEAAVRAIDEMFRQTGPAVFGDDGLMKKGVLVRHLVLPGSVPDSKRVLRYLHSTYGNDIYISIMRQYTPTAAVSSHPLLSQKVSDEEYARVLEFAGSIGIENGFIQEGEAALESFIPAWDLEGIIPETISPGTDTL
ncbi:MAG: radical SAM protein [Lachnospiraceae bacterium]|nr:radical SAM protein [Lachnospiraceae bacterium]